MKSKVAVLVAMAMGVMSLVAAGSWAGKKVSILGDSYSTFAGVSGDPANDSLPAGDLAGCKEFENNPFYPGDVSIQESDTWWRQVLASLGGTLDKNNSVGGSEITRDVGSGANIPKDGRNLIRSFVHRATNGALGNPDVILVLGGTNDGWDGLDQTEFKTGVTTLFAALKSGYPNAQVIVIVPAQANGTAGIAGISADLRTVLLNGAAGSGFLSVDLDEVGFVADDFKYGHPKASGMTKIANAVVNAVDAAPTFYKTLETDGRGYILTDYQPKTSRSRIEYDLRFLYLGLPVGLGIANGTSSSGAANDKEWGGYFNSSTRTFTYYTEPGGAGADFGAGFCDTSVRHTIAMGQGKVTLDDQTTATTTPAEDWTTGGKFALFTVNYGGTTFSSKANVRVAGIRVFEGDTVVRSWVPAKNANGTATLYDLVNKKFETVKAGVFAVDDTVDPTWAAQAANSWTAQPSVPSSVTAGTLPTISLGTAKYGNGTQTATYTAKDIQNLPAGTYTQVVEVKSTVGYRGLREELTFTVTGTVPTAASVAPRAVAPLGGVSVATHTAKQKEFIGLSAAQRKRVLAVLYERERAEYAANDGHPQPVRLQWNGGDGECTVKVYRGEETTPVQTHVVVTRWTDGNFFDLDNLEIGQAYRWTVSNAKGTAEGSFVTESETPRLFNAGIIGNTRDLGGYVGLDGRRVRQGMFLRSRCFDTNNKKTYASILTATEVAFFRDFIGLKTEIDLRGDSWITQSFVPGVTTRVNTVWPLDYTGSYLTDATKKSAMKAALNPIFDAAKYPIDVHCHSGQDRTGMYCFILEALLGVSEEDCIRDWEWSALGNSGFNAGDTYQLDSFLAKFRTLGGATTQAKAETFMTWLGYSSAQIAAFREIMLEPATPVHVHTVENVPAVAATYVKPGRTAGTKCSECGEVLFAGEVIPVIASRPTCSAQVAADGKAKLTFANVLAPVVVSVVYGDEDRGEEYFRDADWDGGEEPCGWDHWEVVAFVPAGTTSYEDYVIPGWGTTATHARFLVTPYEQTPKATLETIVATDPAGQVLDTGFSPDGGTRLNLTMKLGVDPANKTLVDTPSDAAGALAYGISFDASRHPVYAYDTATYAVGAAAANGSDVRFYMNLDESGKTGWRTRIGGTNYYAAGKPSAPSAKTTDGTIRIYGLGTFSPVTIADAQGATQAYFAPVTGFDAAGNEVVGFLDTISMTLHPSSGATAFAKGPANEGYRKDLLVNVTMLAATATIGAGDTPEPEPAYGELFDYLQTDGAGYIRTGVVPNLRTTRVEMTFVLTHPEKDQTLCFASEAVASAAGGTAISGNGNEFGLAYYTSVNFGTTSSPDKRHGFQYYCEGLGEAKFLKDFDDSTGKHVFVFGGATLKVDGGEIATTGTPNDSTAGGELVLFTTTFGKGLTNFADARIYSLRIYESDVLTHDYRPCTDKSGKAGLWDAKTNEVLLPTSDGFVAANEAADAWTQPAADTTAAIANALAADGFDAVTQTAFADLEAFGAFKAYCVQKLGLVNPKDESKAGVKANALLGYALGAETVPNEAISSDDVKIDSIARDAGSVVVTVTVRGFAPQDKASVKSALDAVLSATGGESLTEMSAGNVSAEGRVQNDVLSVSVEPKQSAANAFFVRIVIRNGRTEE